MHLPKSTILTVSLSLALLPVMLSGCNKAADTTGGANTTTNFGSSTGASGDATPAASTTTESAQAESNSTTAPTVDPSLPKVKVDPGHNGMGMEEDGAVKYLLAPGKGFALDLGDFAWTETAETKGGRKSIQILIVNQDRPYNVNYVEGQKVYAVEPPEGFKAGQKAMIGIGREVTANDVKFHPQWIGYLQVQ